MRWPLSTLTTPDGKSLVASTSASVKAGSGRSSGASATTTLPPHRAGARRRTRPASGRLVRRDDADDAGRLGDREVEVGAGDRVDGAGDLGQLVGPARVPDEGLHRLVQLGARLPATAEQLAELRRAARRASRPRGTGSGRGSSRCVRTSPRKPCARRAPRRAGPCASRAARSPCRRAGRRARTRSARTRRRRTACRSCGRRFVAAVFPGIRPAPGRAAVRARRPRARTPTPCSRRRARSGRSG